MAPRTRSDTPSDANDPALPLKRQARRRLLGALVLATGVAIGFALFFDAEPRPALDDIQVRIPSRDSPLPDRADGRERAATATVVPPAAVGATDASGPTAPAPVEPASAGVSDAAEGRREPVAPEAAATGSASAGPAPQAAAEPASAPAVAAAKPSAAEARPETKAAAAEPPRGQGYFLQVGAFASEKAARDQVERIRRLGATAFTERIRTQQGERTRVRLGPFATRDASDAMRQRLRSAGIDVTLVSP
jgi:DedD protein